MSVTANNPNVNESASDDLLSIVSGSDCRPPTVTVAQNSSGPSTALPFRMSEKITLETATEVNCSDVLNTQKQWEVRIQVAGEGYESINISGIAPSTHNKSTLVIPSRSLSYGLYAVRFFARMWDTRDEDVMKTRQLPFQGEAGTYLRIVPTPLKVSFFSGPQTYITRGRGQQLRLEPYLYSFDPDHPEEKVCKKYAFFVLNPINNFPQAVGLEFRWFCRQVNAFPQNESYPTNETRNGNLWGNGVFIPNHTPPDVDGGCFGTGPGDQKTLKASGLLI